MDTGLELLWAFPRLRTTPFEVTSPADNAYNCVAWALGKTDRWWWPLTGYYWPEDPRCEALEAFQGVFSSFGYAVCEHDTLEPGIEKIAIYSDQDGVPTHVARQLPSGLWTSKCGRSHDITHTLDGLAHSDYGKVALIMQRPRP